MTLLVIKTEQIPIKVNLSSIVPPPKMTEELFYAFCQVNRDLRIERSAAGEVIIMPPACSDTGNRNLRIAQQLANWADQDGTGEVFDSSAGFTLPNGAVRSPDVAWVRLDRWHRLSNQQKASFAPICPDFVIELRSASDPLSSLQEKMQEYRDSGVRLGIMIDRQSKSVYCYRSMASVEILEYPSEVNCSPELNGFSLKMQRIW